MSVEGAFLEVLQYLDKIWGIPSSSDKAKLKRLAFIPVANGTRLVWAKSLFARLTINMSPFAFELPSPFLPFVTILRDLDMQESLIKFYAREPLNGSKIMWLSAPQSKCNPKNEKLQTLKTLEKLRALYYSFFLTKKKSLRGIRSSCNFFFVFTMFLPILS